MNLLIGSKALAVYNKGLVKSGAKRSWDTDWIVSLDSYNKFIEKTKPTKILKKRNGFVAFNKNKINEFEIAQEGTTAKSLLLIMAQNPELYMVYNGVRAAHPNVIFTLKKSHRYLKNSPHFMKTMLDYNYLKNKGCSVPDVLKDWYKEREKETYNYKHPNLNTSKKEFFNGDSVNYIYDHDTIHLAMAHLDKPAYEYYKEDQAEVKCSKQLFFSLPEEIRLFGVLEEAYVLALERSQVPFPNKVEPKKSFEIALMKVCTSITSGWFRAYAYENYFKVYELFDEKYVDRFWDGVTKGIVRKL